MPKSCNECKFDLRTDICQAFCEWNAEHPYSIRATDRLPDCPLSEAHEPCEDVVSRQAAIDIERNATVDTNPSHFEAHQKFTQFLDDAEVSSFGRWQWANGFNTALTAVGIDLKKLPSAQPERSRAEERYKDLLEYFSGCDDKGEYVLKTSKGFKAWLERMHWHVGECNRLARQLQKQPNIVRCKECESYLRQGRCTRNDDLWGKDDYCSRGRRRDG